MITVFRSNQIHPVSGLKEQIRKQIEQLPRMLSAIGTLETVYRFEYDCEELDLLTWLHNQSVDEKLYWSDRGGLFEVAGVLIADAISGQGVFDYHEVFAQLQRKLSSDNQNLRYYGGFCFDVNSMSEEWDLYGSYRWVIPRYEIIRQDQNYTFAVNIGINDISVDHIHRILRDLEKIDFSSTTNYRDVPRITSREDKPTFNQWNNSFEDILNGPWSKIVLARRTDFKFDVSIRPSALIKFLKEQTPNCYHFCFQPDKQHGFLGATPERLIKVVDNDLWTEAVAGTTPKGNSTDQTKQEERKLLHDDKFQREHSFVVEYIKTNLNNFCSRYQFDQQADLLKLENGQHLITRFEGVMNQGCRMEDVLKGLHPTPAVAGYPQEGIVDALIKNESFARGWYAGPVGYIGYDQMEFAVAIRSGLIDNDKLSLFAGAGIVRGSTAQEEWDEIENKISRFMKVFDR
ncbi:MAG: isochorismate synthase MenF [Candidatus Omnitrophota bacterium]